MKLTIRDVARKAGVSIAAASLALNDREGVSEETRLRVKRVAKEIHYTPDFSARSLVTQDSNCIGLMVPEIQNPFYSAVVDAMSRIADEKGYTLLLGISDSKPRAERRFLEMFLSWRAMGVIIVPMLASDPDVRHLDMLRQADVPLVFCTETYAGAEEPTVMCDFAKGQYEITRMLLQKGFTDLRYVTADMNTNFVRLRLDGYRRALEEAGMALHDSKIMRLKAPRYDSAYAAADIFHRDLPEAIVCINDIMTIGLIKKMAELGIRVPDDVAVVGFDDVQVAELVTPQLTTVHQPVGEICERTFEILERKIRAGAGQREIGRGEVILIEPHVVVRESAR